MPACEEAGEKGAAISQNFLILEIAGSQPLSNLLFACLSYFRGIFYLAKKPSRSNTKLVVNIVFDYDSVTF